RAGWPSAGHGVGAAPAGHANGEAVWTEADLIARRADRGDPDFIVASGGAGHFPGKESRLAGSISGVTAGRAHSDSGAAEAALVTKIVVGVGESFRPRGYQR